MPKGNKISQGDDRYTPAWVFEGLAVKFDLDPCAPVGGVSWIPIKNLFTIEDNGLEQEWFGNVWLNPPYSKPTPWIDKFIKHKNGIALVPCSQGRWWYKLWNQCDAVMPMPCNMKFVSPTGGVRMISFQTSLFAFGNQNVEALLRLQTNAVR
jgi:hypothetical protein